MHAQFIDSVCASSLVQCVNRAGARCGGDTVTAAATAVNGDDDDDGDYHHTGIFRPTFGDNRRQSAHAFATSTIQFDVTARVGQLMVAPPDRAMFTHEHTLHARDFDL